MTLSWPTLIDDLLAGRDLGADRAAAALEAMMRGEVDPVVAAGFLVALRGRGITAAELAAMVEVMLAAAVRVPVEGPVVDTCGTGGDRAGTFNISTVAAVVVAAAGVPVAKHGNRAASSRCGSADLVEAWGVPLDATPEAVAATIREAGIGFLFAPAFHPAMRHVAPVRRALGVRTVFNVLGPLCNPAGATHQLVGVAEAELAPVVAEALARLGRRALVCHGADGIDELSVCAPSDVWEVVDGEVRRWRLDPADVGCGPVPAGALHGGELDTNLRIAEAVLSGQEGPASDAVALNAGAALYVAGRAESVAEGVAAARDVLASGAAATLRDRWVAAAQRHHATAGSVS